MSKELFLHIGAAKAASTSVQRFLFQNSDTLTELGYRLTDGELGTDGPPANPLWLFQRLMDEKDGPDVVAERLARLQGIPVISAENLMTPGMARLFSKADFDIRVLFIVRRQDDWIYSSWKQTQHKNGTPLDRFVGNCLKQHLPNFPETVKTWSKVVPPENISVVSLDLMDETLDEVVLRWLGLVDHMGQFARCEDKRNESFDYRLLDLLRRHSGAFAAPQDRRIELALARYSRLAYARKYRLPEELSERVLEHFKDDNALLLGEDAAQQLNSIARIDRAFAAQSDAISDHDFAIACLVEALGKIGDELTRARRDVNHLGRDSNENAARFARLENRLAVLEQRPPAWRRAARRIWR